jgi:DNA-binding MarR family transcriptional regulator
MAKQDEILSKLTNNYLKESFNDPVFTTIGKFTHTAQLLSKYNDSILIRYNLSMSRLKTLHAIILWGPIHPKDIANVLVQSRQNTLDAVHRLLKDGLISQKQDPEDRRSVKVTITKKGLLTVKDSLPVIKEINKDTLMFISMDEIEKLSKLLSVIRKNIHKKLNDSNS